MTCQLVNIQQRRQDPNRGVPKRPRRGGAAIGAIWLAVACMSWGITPAAAAGVNPGTPPGPFYPATLLPPNLGYLTGIVCPQVNTCYIGGSTSGSNPTGLVLKVTASADEVTTKTYSPNVPMDRLSSISCMSLNECYALGTNQYGTSDITGTVNGGSSWEDEATPSVPNQPNYVSAISCAPMFCMAVGTEPQSAGTTPSATPSSTPGSNQSVVWAWNNQRFMQPKSSTPALSRCPPRRSTLALLASCPPCHATCPTIAGSLVVGSGIPPTAVRPGPSTIRPNCRQPVEVLCGATSTRSSSPRRWTASLRVGISAEGQSRRARELSFAPPTAAPPGPKASRHR